MYMYLCCKTRSVLLLAALWICVCLTVLTESVCILLVLKCSLMFSDLPLYMLQSGNLTWDRTSVYCKCKWGGARSRGISTWARILPEAQVTCNQLQTGLLTSYISDQLCYHLSSLLHLSRTPVEDICHIDCKACDDVSLFFYTVVITATKVSQKH